MNRSKNDNSKFFLVFHLLLAALMLLLTPAVFSQKYYFQNYNVEQGLVQSQAQGISQDEFGYIWIATLGGISRFDGFSFRNYDKNDGLSSLICFELQLLHHNLYVSTQSGLQVFDGRLFKEQAGSRAMPGFLQQMMFASDEFFCRANNQLFRKTGDEFKSVDAFIGENVTALSADSDERLLVAVWKKGIFRKEGKGWKLLIPMVDPQEAVKDIICTAGNELVLLLNNSVVRYSGGVRTTLVATGMIKSVFTTIATDRRGRIWLGTTKGCYIIQEGDDPEYVGEKAGLTDNAVSDILPDREGNLWFATDGDGIYMLNNASLYTLSAANGMKGHVVMGLATGMQDTWLGTSDGGLQKYRNGQFAAIQIPSLNPEAQKSNSLLMDADGNLWVGTQGGGLWVKEKSGFREIKKESGQSFHEVISIYETTDRKIWICTSDGVYFFENGLMKKARGIDQPCFTILESSPGNMLVASTAGLFLLSAKKGAALINLPGKAPGVVNCIKRWNRYFVLGTEDAGLVCWKPETNERIDFTMKEGLSSNFIFSIYAGDSSCLYVGTGHGISRIEWNPGKSTRIKNYSASGNPFGPECNLNAVQRAPDGKLWFGTTKGIIVYDPNDTLQTHAAPSIYLTGIRLFSRELPSGTQDSTYAWVPLPRRLSMAPRQNQLSFAFTALWYSHPSAVKYWYKLQGADTGYTLLTTNREVVFSNLPPGSYRFQAYAETEDGTVSSNRIDYPFEIRAPFFQQTWFRVLVIVILLAIGAGIQYIRAFIKSRREKMIDQIRKEEQQRIQERTSEDLHDDLGNKITRITVLTDVLKNKLEPQEPSNRKLLEEIRSNAASLYLGTKDIIWSLTPGNDSLYAVLERCQLFASHLFEETGIDFRLTGLREYWKEIPLPVEINRNLMMIVKEALNNTLKHSGASLSCIVVEKLSESRIRLSICDNGVGIMDPQKVHGNGLANIRKRTERIQGRLEMVNETPGGLILTIEFNIPLKAGVESL